MIVDHMYQKRGILKLIQHKFDVSTPHDGIALEVFELEKDFPDFESIMEWLGDISAISITGKPDPMEMVHHWYSLDTLDQADMDYHVKTFYYIFKDSNYGKIYEEIVGADKFGQYKLHEDDIHLKPSSFNPKTGILSITPFLDFDLSYNKQKPAKEQKAFLERFFRNGATLKSGLTYYQLSVSNRLTPVNEKMLKKYTNHQTQINKKFTEVTGLKKLIIYKEKVFRINPLYLEKS